jgi:hypothetical protein
MFRSTLSLAALLLIASGTAIATPQNETAAEAAPAEARERAVTTEQPVYGPILAKDPVVRDEIKGLYEEIRALEEATQADLDGMYAELAAATDFDTRREINGRIGQAKRGLEEWSIELHGRIARLNGQEARAQEFERALDQIRNPENYRRTPEDVPVRNPATGQ